jgi:predicted amidohydrolase
MRLMAGIMTESTEPIRGAVAQLKGLDKAVYKIQRLHFAASLAWQTMQARRQALPDRDNFFQYVFLAPEYFFSNNRYQNSRFFDHDVKRFILKELSAIARKYPQMLIIPGTVLWRKDAFVQDSRNIGLGKTPAPTNKTSTVDNALARIAAAKPLGTATKSDWGFVADNQATGYLNQPDVKQYMATQSFGQQELLLLTAASHRTEIAQNVAYVCMGDRMLKYHKIGNYEEVKQESGNLVFVPGSIKGFFSVGAVNYGLEICMDHALSMIPAANQAHVRVIVSSYVNFRADTWSGSNVVLLHSSTERADSSKGVATDPVMIDDKRVKLLAERDASGKCTVYDLEIDHKALGIGPSGAGLSSNTLPPVRHV